MQTHVQYRKVELDDLPQIVRIANQAFVEMGRLPARFAKRALQHMKDYPEWQLLAVRDEKVLVNVGSVGQPRDDDNRSCYVILDMDNKTVNYRRVVYDIDVTAKKIYAVPDLSDALGDRIKHGR